MDALIKFKEKSEKSVPKPKRKPPVPAKVVKKLRAVKFLLDTNAHIIDYIKIKGI